ncbi:MAG: glycosyltransferase family 2 protein [Chloroflexi bacterium]|nr:glycosyltransferase family 2 protein [Chloroflexota bacterium]
MGLLFDILSVIFWLSGAALFWTYFGYPLLMYVLAKVAPKAIHKDASLKPSVTMVIPAYNEADVIGRKLANTLQIDYPKDKLQVLVIDDGSTDDTVKIIEEYVPRGITLLRQPTRGGKMGAVNMGFANATGEIVILSDASPDYERSALNILLQPFADEKVGVVVGTLALWDAKNAVARPAGLYWKYEAALRKWESRTGNTVAVHGNMFAIRRTLFKPLKTGTVNDEFSIAMEAIRQGYRVVYEPDAISYDDASASMRDEFKRRVRINAGRFQALFSAGYLRAPTLDTGFRLFSHKLLRPLTPVFMLLALATNLLAFLWPSAGLLALNGALGMLTLLAQAVFYLLSFLGYMAEKRGRGHRLLNVPYYFTSSNLAALVGFWRWLRGTQKVTWQKREAAN